MTIYEASTTINSGPETVWRILTDAEQHADWDPTHARIEGRIAPGEAIVLHHRGNRQPKTLPMQVTEFEPPKRMIWTGGGMPEAIFKGEHIVTLTPEHRNVHVSLRLEFTGTMAFVLTKCIPDPTPDLAAFLQALRERCEAEVRLCCQP
jgi:uncharacterized protein YndB with AHSA1/START domain